MSFPNNSHSNISPVATLTLIDGEPCAQLSVSDRGFSYGDGLFETILVVGTILPFKQLHWQRLQRGCERLGIVLDVNLLEQYIDKLLQHLSKSDGNSQQKSILKIIVTRGMGKRGYKPSTGAIPTIVLQLSKKPEPIDYNDGVALCLCKHRLGLNPSLAGIKHLNRLDNILASMEIDSEKYQEGLIFDLNDNLIEAVSRNVFIIKDEELITPILDNCGVAGVARDLILEKYRQQLSLLTKEKPITRDELFNADEVFLTNSIDGVWPVKSIEDKKIPVGPAAQKLQQIWQQDIAGSCKHE